MTDAIPLIVALLGALTAIVGFGSSIAISRNNSKKLDKADTKIDAVTLLVDGNLHDVQEKLKIAIERITELDAAMDKVAAASRSVPEQTTTQALKETADIAAGVGSISVLEIVSTPLPPPPEPPQLP